MSSDLEDFLKRAAQRRAEHVAVRGEQQERAQKQNLAPRAPEYTDRNRERAAPAFDDDDEVYVAEVVHPDPSGYPTFPSTSMAEHHSGTSIGSSPFNRDAVTLDAVTGNAVTGNAVTGNAVDRAYSPPSSQAPSNYETRAGWSGSVAQHDREQADAKTVGETASAASIVKLLKSPMGVKQAFLMREILDRPSSRW